MLVYCVYDNIWRMALLTLGVCRYLLDLVVS